MSLTLRDRPVLRSVTGTLAVGAVTVILGANGAGKSTLLSCLAGLREPDTGQVSLGGQPLASLSPPHRARLIGLLPQQADIHWNINVRALVALGRLPHRGRWGLHADDERAISAALAAADCVHLASRKAQRLSGGEQARVLLARVLAGEPRWILADEPFASLDPAHQLDAAACLRAAAGQGAGVAVVLHDLTQAARLADRVIVMKNGQVLAAGPVPEVMTPALLAAAYGVRVHVGHDEDGAPLIVPVARLS
ncbi:ABC transporter ATP-binding protein [Novosphingobium sp.]|uniref:ABC transporter ATP-binding protein n=1 Tax=Novosphingobium sp. TaxID=1874826 RepID=UPI003BAA139D